MSGESAPRHSAFSGAQTTASVCCRAFLRQSVQNHSRQAPFQRESSKDSSLRRSIQPDFSAAARASDDSSQKPSRTATAALQSARKSPRREFPRSFPLEKVGRTSVRSSQTSLPRVCAPQHNLGSKPVSFAQPAQRIVTWHFARIRHGNGQPAQVPSCVRCSFWSFSEASL